MLTFFTPNEANSLLPDVQRMLQDLLAKKNRIETERKALEEQSLEEASEASELGNKKIQELMEEIERLVDLLEDMGCIVRHIDDGIVDFPALRYGKRVYLCWRLGEPKVAYWHDMEIGFAGRSWINENEIANAYV